jgi:hypothetical protein
MTDGCRGNIGIRLHRNQRLLWLRLHRTRRRRVAHGDNVELRNEQMRPRRNTVDRAAEAVDAGAVRGVATAGCVRLGWFGSLLSSG